jgi:hypothetical protein
MTGCLDFRGGEPELEALGLGAAALRWQRLGYSVLALGPGSKRPHHLFTRGVDWATRDPAMVEWMWGQDKLAGIGVATGSVSRLLVIDLDNHGGTPGWESFFLQFLPSQPGPDGWGLSLDASVVVATPSGGFHIWLRLPPGVTVPGRTGILPGVDVKSDGGYVVAAPSRVWQDSLDGGRVLVPYRLGGGCPCVLPEAPEWLLSWIEQTPGTGAGSGGDGDPLPDLGELAHTGLPAGQRNVMVHRLACSLYRRCGVGPGGTAAVRAALEPVLAATDMRGFGAGELGRALESARRFVQQQQAKEARAWHSR